MHQSDFHLPKLDETIQATLIDTKNRVIYGNLREGINISKTGFFTKDDKSVLVSTAAQEHLNIKFIVVESSNLHRELKELFNSIVIFTSVFTMLMIILAYFLSKLFMKPLHQRVKQIEDFVHDTAHELNTPITALQMITSQSLKKGTCSAKSLKNISLISKQLFDIYSALSYLSFNQEEKNSPQNIDIISSLQKSILYYFELAQSKNIELIFHTNEKEYIVNIDEVKLNMLLGNLINNAIKYSHPNSKVEISFESDTLKVKDYGIGIAPEKLNKIYERFNRETSYAGGFGIGLSIVKKIADEYNFKVDVVSEPDIGSSFYITLNNSN